MGSLERTLVEDVARSYKAGVFRAGPGEILPGQEELDSADEEPEDERDLEPTALAVEDASYFDDADDDLMDLGISFGKMRITERIGGLVRPKMAEELKQAMNEVPEQKNPDGTPMNKPNPLRAAGTNFLGPGKDFIAPSSSFFFAPDPR
ncbi:hypothetical protein LTS18_002353, partial [Coniosporium uncinatum]